MKALLLNFFFLLSLISFGQVNLSYQKPDQSILNLAEAPMAPRISMDRNGENILFLYRSNYKTIDELSETEMRLGGLRINPVTNIGSRTTYYTDFKIRKGRNGDPKDISGMPENGRLAYLSWSPNQNFAAFTNTTSKGVELWYIDINTAQAKKLTEDNLNANMGRPYTWSKGSDYLLVQTLPSSKKQLIDPKKSVPEGPTISVSEAGVKAQNRTYQDLLKNPNDEYNFEQLALSDIQKIDLNGKSSNWKSTDIYESINFSPDGNYVMVTTINKPFSYLVPYSRFPSTTTIYDANANLVKKILEVPLIEDLPQGFMAVRTGMRNLSWRNDQPATLVWTEALDEGDPAKEVAFRDEVFQLKAPFTAKKQSLLKTKDRFAGIRWGNDNTAIAYDRWWNSRNTRTYLFDPSNANKAPKVLSDRNYQDVYSDPGNFVTTLNAYDESVWISMMEKPI